MDETTTIPVGSGANFNFDLQLTCDGLSASSIFVALLIAAVENEQFKVKGYDEENFPRFTLASGSRFRIDYADVILVNGTVLVASATPQDWSVEERRGDAESFLEPLLAKVVGKDGGCCSLAPRKSD